LKFNGWEIEYNSAFGQFHILNNSATLMYYSPVMSIYPDASTIWTPNAGAAPGGTTEPFYL